MATEAEENRDDVPISCSICGKFVGYFPHDRITLERRITICDTCGTPSAGPHLPRDPTGP